MRRLDSRVANLEAKQKPPFRQVHSLVQRIEQTRDQMLDAYGRGRIGPDDIVIINRIVSPRLKPDGLMPLDVDLPENQQ